MAFPGRPQRWIFAAVVVLNIAYFGVGPMITASHWRSTVRPTIHVLSPPGANPVVVVIEDGSASFYHGDSVSVYSAATLVTLAGVNCDPAGLSSRAAAQDGRVNVYIPLLPAAQAPGGPVPLTCRIHVTVSKPRLFSGTSSAVAEFDVDASATVVLPPGMLPEARQ